MSEAPTSETAIDVAATRLALENAVVDAPPPAIPIWRELAVVRGWVARARSAERGRSSRFSTTSPPSFPRIPALWMARASTAGQALGPITAISRNAQMYSGIDRSRTSRARVA